MEIDKEKIHVDLMLLFSRLLVLIERGEKIRKYFRFERTAFPTSLFKNGMMRKANKSKLVKALKKNVSSNSYQADQSFHVLDGGALLHKVKWLPNTSCQSILNQYSRYVKSKYGRACIVLTATTMVRTPKIMSTNEEREKWLLMSAWKTYK